MVSDEDLLRSRTTLFASFSGRRSIQSFNCLFSWGQAPKPPGSASPRDGSEMVSAKTFCEAEQRFLLLFLEKEEYNRLIGYFLGGKPPNPLGRLRRGLGRKWFRRRPSAKQNNAFCFFFWKKKNATNQLGFFFCSI
jgi:hypothetical protein